MGWGRVLGQAGVEWGDGAKGRGVRWGRAPQRAQEGAKPRVGPVLVRGHHEPRRADGAVGRRRGRGRCGGQAERGEGSSSRHRELVARDLPKLQLSREFHPLTRQELAAPGRARERAALGDEASQRGVVGAECLPAGSQHCARRLPLGALAFSLLNQHLHCVAAVQPEARCDGVGAACVYACNLPQLLAGCKAYRAHHREVRWPRRGWRRQLRRGGTRRCRRRHCARRKTQRDTRAKNAHARKKRAERWSGRRRAAEPRAARGSPALPRAAGSLITRAQCRSRRCGCALRGRVGAHLMLTC